MTLDLLTFAAIGAGLAWAFWAVTTALGAPMGDAPW